MNQIGLKLNDFSTIADGLTNTGTIYGGQAAIKVGFESQIAGGLTNSGLINGATYAGILVGGYASVIDSINNQS
ncbi:hypothetical protein, partial [Polynucleobacter asymbioticus]